MIDEGKIKESVRLFLEGIGEDINREGLLDTPDRIARMCSEVFGGIGADASEILSKTFTSESKGIVVERDIPFYSMCEHHLLPFWGKAYIGYVPKGKVAGLSKLARTVDVYARRPQIQERMTDQIADALIEYLGCDSVIVVLKAEHMCMSMRGVKKGGTQTVTVATRGEFENSSDMQDRFFRMIEMK